jgi:hypothetical protein
MILFGVKMQRTMEDLLPRNFINYENKGRQTNNGLIYVQYTNACKLGAN